MFSSLSWKEYTLTITLLMVTYYAFVGYRFYIWEISSMLRSLFNRHAAPGKVTEPGSIPQHREESEEEENYQQLFNQISSWLNKTAAQKLVLQEYKAGIHHILVPLSHLRHSPMRHQVNEWIARESGSLGLPALTAEEIDNLWI